MITFAEVIFATPCQMPCLIDTLFPMLAVASDNFLCQPPFLTVCDGGVPEVVA